MAVQRTKFSAVFVDSGERKKSRLADWLYAVEAPYLSNSLSHSLFMKQGTMRFCRAAAAMSSSEEWDPESTYPP